MAKSKRTAVRFRVNMFATCQFYYVEWLWKKKRNVERRAANLEETRKLLFWNAWHWREQ